MDIPTIIERLGQAEAPPEDVIGAAREERGAAAPAFIDLVERYLAGEPSAAAEGALFYVFHLLGEWRETSAYRPLARLLASDPERLEAVLGDALVSTSHRIMAAVFDGDPAPLQAVIEAEDADPYVRSRMLEALAMLVLRGELERGEVARYLRDAFSNLRPRDASFVWFGWRSAIAALGLAELTSLVRNAFERGLIDRTEMTFAEHQSDLKHALAHPESPWPQAAPNEFAPFEDTIAELSSWYAFSPEYLERQAAEDAFAPRFGMAEPAINPFKGVGRNHPCPCGSGRKFKRCCLA
jgi:hypothetical protein